MPVRRVKLFRNGRSQAVRIPREFELPGNEALIRREGEKLVLEPAPEPFLEWLARQPDIEEDFPEIDDPPPEPVDL